MHTAPQKPQRGRPRDNDLDQKILQAAWELLGDMSLSELTIHGIAQHAGTTRPAIYRRWKSVEGIVIDSLLDVVGEKVETPQEGDPPEQLREYIWLLAKFLQSRVGRVVAEILGRGQSDPELMVKFHNVFLLPRRDHGKSIIQIGQERGFFRTDLDTEMIIDLYAGPIYFRAFAQHGGLDNTFAQALADHVLNSISLTCGHDTCT